MTSVNQRSQEIRVIAVAEPIMTRETPLSQSVQRFDEAMALTQEDISPASTSVMTQVSDLHNITETRLLMQRSLLCQLIQYGVKPENEE